MKLQYFLRLLDGHDLDTEIKVLKNGKDMDSIEFGENTGYSMWEGDKIEMSFVINRNKKQ